MNMSNNPQQTMLGPASADATGARFHRREGRRWIAEKGCSERDRRREDREEEAQCRDYPT